MSNSISLLSVTVSGPLNGRNSVFKSKDISMSRWTSEEAAAIAEVRKRASKELELCPKYPEVVGDRRILRFLRGKQLDIDSSSDMFIKFLKWRRENGVDRIRQEIVFGGLDSPLKFPNGAKIIELAPQIVITSNAMDKKGRPIAMEQYNFSPREVLKVVTQEQYIRFLIYALEYRAIVVEQMSHEIEMRYLQDHPNPEDRKDGYGVVLLVYIIRDLRGIGFSHLGGEGRSIVKAALSVGLANYPEYMGKSAMTSVPWVFNSMWFFISALLDEFTLAKISLSGGNYMETLLKDVDFEHIPASLGGGFTLYNETYQFDVSRDGALHYEGAEHDREAFLATWREEQRVLEDQQTSSDDSDSDSDNEMRKEKKEVEITSRLTPLQREVLKEKMAANGQLLLPANQTTKDNHELKANEAATQPSEKVSSSLLHHMVHNVKKFLKQWKLALLYCWTEHRIHSLSIVLILSVLYSTDRYAFALLVTASVFSSFVMFLIH